jgi:hypothetical protein
VDVADLVGLTGGDNSRGIALVDLDNDGRLDVVIANQHAGPSLFRNAPSAVVGGRAANGWLGVRLVGNGRSCSRDALGSTITLRADGAPPQMREIQQANGFAAQHDARVHFGLGTPHPDTVDVHVRWCGAVDRDYRFAADRYVRIEQ